MGLKAVELDAPASAMALERAGPFTPDLPDPESVWLLDRADGASWRVVNRLLAAGEDVEVEMGGEGRFVVQGGDGLGQVLQDLGVHPNAEVLSGEAVGGLPTTRPLSPFRVAVFRPWQASMDEGWIRWILEHYDFPVSELRNERVRAGALNDEFDVIVIPSLDPRSILEGNREGTVPPEYLGGIGAEGVEALKSFAAEGGTLFFHEGSTAFALQEFGLPLQAVSVSARTAGFYSPGSILRFAWDVTPALTRGMNPDGVAFVSSRGSFFEVTGEGEGPVGDPKVLGRFPEEGDLLLSGYLEGGESIAGASPVMEIPYGEGHLVLVGFSLHNRAQMVANFKLLFNAVAGI